MHVKEFEGTEVLACWALKAQYIDKFHSQVVAIFLWLQIGSDQVACILQ